MADFRNSKTAQAAFVYGSLPHVLGPMEVVRANIDIGMSGEMDGWAICLTEVLDWPFATDDAGVAFDQANLYGVRTRTWRRPIADGGGDSDSYWTAVPKALPSGYTATTRGEGILTQGFYADYLGSDPFVGDHSSNLRKPTGLVYATDSAWVPMNQGRRVVDASFGDVYSGAWAGYSDPPNGSGDGVYLVALITSSFALGHVGFRGGVLTFTSSGSGSAGSATFEIIGVKQGDYWDPLDASATSSVVEVLESGAVSWTTSPTVTVVNLGTMVGATLGTRYSFYIRYAVADAQAIFDSDHVLQMSPRTDVPLCYSASMANRVAPGGYVPP